MFLGIDVGGTHTDAVVVGLQGPAGPQGVIAEAKVPTDHDNLLHSVRGALKAVLRRVDPAAVRRLNLSTTLSTNAIVESKTEDVGVLVSAGPGIDPEHQHVGGQYHVIDGFIDHRGHEVAPLDAAGLAAAAEAMRAAGIRVFAAVGKFSTRNPAHEEALAGAVAGDADFVTRGHALSGVLGFPRRVATAYFNSAVWRQYNDFAWAVEESVRDFGLECEVNILKADGGTMPLELSKSLPVESILSGPAASVMGIIALSDIREDCVILDIGGTTTDIAVFAGGAPLIEHDGMTVGSYPTLVRALKIRSIGIGGDSALNVSATLGVTAGPERKGPALAAWALGGATACTLGPVGGLPREVRGKVCVPALTDALNVLGHCAFGEVEASRSGIAKLAALWDMAPDRLCRRAVDYALGKIREAVDDLIDEINERPVYTIFELLKGKRINPQRVYVMGGPAAALAPLLEKALGREVVLPEHYSVANAIGAALTRTTLDVELFADTQRGTMFIPSLGVTREIPRTYTLRQAEADVKAELLAHLRRLGVEVDDGEPEVLESGAFNMVEGMMTMGKNIRVRCQVRPAVGRVSGR
ncbi:MAG: hydantoinase/oxoprolinase family protein [Thermodesulfobacteriota bacterium]